MTTNWLKCYLIMDKFIILQLKDYIFVQFIEVYFCTPCTPIYSDN